MALRPKRTSALLAVTSALLTVCVAGSGLASAAIVPSTSAPPVWAYGTVRTVSLQGSGANYTYSGSATLGLSVVFNETENSSAGIITVNAVRTIGAIIHAKFCIPDCSALRSANFSYHAWETTDAWANLTTAGMVTESSTSVPALALLNSSVAVTAKLRESGQYSLGSVILRQRSLEVNVTGNLHVNLSAGLGLLPLELAPGATWSSSSAYLAAGSVKWSSYRTLGGELVLFPYRRPASGTLSATSSGTLDLAGSYPTGSDVSLQGTAYPAVNLTITGNYSLQEGVFLVPASADVFGGAAHPWSAFQNGSAVVTTTRLDVHPGKYFRGHLPIVASGFYVNSATSSAAADAVPSGPGAVPAAIPAAASGTSTFVQGEPEPVAQARSGENCLVTGTGCPGIPGHGLPLRLIVVAGAGSVAAAVIAMAVIARRRPPVPVYPNSALYPPGASVGAPARPTPPPKPSEDDPLGHLW